MRHVMYRLYWRWSTIPVGNWSSTYALNGQVLLTLFKLQKSQLKPTKHSTKWGDLAADFPSLGSTFCTPTDPNLAQNFGAPNFSWAASSFHPQCSSLLSKRMSIERVICVQCRGIYSPRIAAFKSNSKLVSNFTLFRFTIGKHNFLFSNSNSALDFHTQ